MAQRTPEEIRASIESNRVELSVAMEKLRLEVTELADWRAHLQRHRREVMIGAAIAGFVIGGGLAALTRRRRR